MLRRVYLARPVDLARLVPNPIAPSELAGMSTWAGPWPGWNWPSSCGSSPAGFLNARPHHAPHDGVWNTVTTIRTPAESRRAARKPRRRGWGPGEKIKLKLGIYGKRLDILKMMQEANMTEVGVLTTDFNQMKNEQHKRIGYRDTLVYTAFAVVAGAAYAITQGASLLV
ncbi:hypothetical protein AB0C84_45310, partial [Actinomadura sp. NPDC048955]|uniref:hypothetical protein n=1 Tax=Actinomadura sp. NPDC048955 TaxID=3158228 RepID=UPI0033BFD134